MTSVFSAMNSVSPVGCLRTNRNILVQPKHKTRCHQFHNRKDSLPLVSAFYLIQLHSMNLVLYQHHVRLATLLYDSRTKPTKIQKNHSWKLMSKGEREITSKLNHFYRGGRILRRKELFNEKEVSHQRPRILGVQEERSYMSLRGERHVHIWSYLIACISSVVFFFCSDFLFPIFSQYPIQDSGGERHLRGGNL